jgi:hypothetical protein
MVKETLLKSLNYTTVSLGILLSLGSIHAKDEEIVGFLPDENGILRLWHDINDDDCFTRRVYACFDGEPNPLAVVPAAFVPVGCNMIPLNLRSEVQEWLQPHLQRLGITDSDNRFKLPTYVYCVVHHPMEESVITRTWRYYDPKLFENEEVSLDFVCFRGGRQIRIMSAGTATGNPLRVSASLVIPRSDTSLTFVSTVRHDDYNVIIIGIIPNLDTTISDGLKSQKSLFSVFRCFVFEPKTTMATVGPIAGEFLRAVENNDSSSIRRVWDSADDDAQREKLLRTYFSLDWTALQIAAMEGYFSSMQALLTLVSRELRINLLKTKDRVGKTVLHLAALSRNPSAIENLLRLLTSEEKAALVRATDKNGKTALHLAVLSNNLYNPSATENLLRSLTPEERAALVRATDKNGKTVLHAAALSRNPSAIENLLRLLTPEERAAPVRATDKNGRTALQYAEGRGRDDIVQALRGL